MLVACVGSRQPKIGVAVKEDEVDVVRVARGLTTGPARAPVAIAKGSRAAKKRMLIV